MAQEAPRLALRGIGKSFPGLCALSDMNPAFGKGAVHVIRDEDRAGTSTLIETADGVNRPSGAEISGDPNDPSLASARWGCRISFLQGGG